MGIPRMAVAFSFDDGPNGEGDTTARLLDVLRKYQVRALFALLGENAGRYPELVRRIRDEGHVIINHGYADTWAVFMGPQAFKANLLRGEAAISAALGEGLNPKLYRPQGGYYRPGQRNIWRAEGYTLVPSSARVYDAVSPGGAKDKVVRGILKKIQDGGGGMILLHDARDSHNRMDRELAADPEGSFNRAWIPEAVEELLRELIQRGYQVSGLDPLDFRPRR